MKKVNLLSLFLACFLTIQTAYSQKSKMNEAFNKASASGWSGVVLAAKDGKIVFEKATGYRSFESRTPLLKTDIFEMASVSKQFTAMMIMMCQEKGLLEYDDDITKYLDIPYPNISISQILTHTSGLPDYQAVMDKHWDKEKVASNEDILEYLRKYHPPMLFEPGEKYEYSNTGYVFLASIVEAVTGQDFIELSRDWIFDPLEMKDTDIRTLDEKAQVKNFAAGHLKDSDGQYINANKFHDSDYTVWLGNRKGPGRVSSTAYDLLKWDQALYLNQLVSRETLQIAFSPMILNDQSESDYGFGWDLEIDEQVGKIVKHTGDNPGYKTIFIRMIDQNKTLIILNNNAHESHADLIRNATEALKNR